MLRASTLEGPPVPEGALLSEVKAGRFESHKVEEQGEAVKTCHVVAIDVVPSFV